LGTRRIPEIAFEIGDESRLDLRRLDILRSEFHTGAEISVHRALAIRSHEDHRPGSWRPVCQRDRIEAYPLSAQVVAEDAAQMILRHLAEIGGSAAKARNAG